MTDTSPSAPQPPASQNPPCRPGRMRRAFLVLALVLAAGLTGAVATQAMNGGFGPGRWHGHGMFGRPMMGGPMGQAFIEERADRMVRHLAIEIEATPDQHDKLRAAVRSAIRDLAPMREKAWLARQQARTLLTQQTVDRAAIEAFRTEQLALAEAFSKRVAQALGDVAEILTPEQRRQIGDFLDEHRRFGRGWRRG